MNENKTTTYGELKCRKAELRNQIEKEIMEPGGNFSRETIEEYRVVLRTIRRTETWLLWTIVSLMLIIAGCHTVNGVGQDLSAWSSPYIEHQER